MSPNLDIGALYPLLPVALAVIVIPIAEVFLARTPRILYVRVSKAWVGSFLSLGAAAALVVSLLFTAQGFGLEARVFNLDNPMILMDSFAHFLNATVLLAALMTVLVSNRFLRDMQINHGEYYALLLASVCGMLMSSSARKSIIRSVDAVRTSIPLTEASRSA